MTEEEIFQKWHLGGAILEPPQYYWQRVKEAMEEYALQSNKGWIEMPATEFPTEDNWYVAFFGSNIPISLWYDSENKWDLTGREMGILTSWLKPPQKVNT
jgi:hypothetical protein